MESIQSFEFGLFEKIQTEIQNLLFITQILLQGSTEHPIFHTLLVIFQQKFSTCAILSQFTFLGARAPL